MARADLLCELIKAGLIKDDVQFRKAAEAICAEERSKQHIVLANKISELLSHSQPRIEKSPQIISSSNGLVNNLFQEKLPI